jgi:hypothetical protein
MSLYREPGSRRRTTAIAAVLGAIVLLAIGYGIGRATAPEPSLQSQIQKLRDDAAPAADAIELVPIHYESSNASTREAAREQLDRALEDFGDVEARLAVVDPAGTRDARAAIERVETLVEDGAPPAQVEQAAAEAEQILRKIAA